MRLESIYSHNSCSGDMEVLRFSSSHTKIPTAIRKLVVELEVSTTSPYAFQRFFF